MMWLVGALYGGFVMANVLKWYWWRFNGYGYFWGMVAGIGGAMVVPQITKTLIANSATIQRIIGPDFNQLYTIPILIVISLVGCIAGTLLSKPEDDAVLKNFYKTVNPWGFWGPIRAKVVAEDPSFVPNHNFKRDMFNVAVGIVWQLCLMTLPIYLVLRQWNWVGGIAVTLVVTSVIIKLNWYDKLEKAPEETSPAAQPQSAT
jgi:hypothetical protein